MNNKLISIFFILCLWQFNLVASLTDDLADPEQSINERLKILSKDVEEALGVSMETYKIHIVTNLPRAIANRSIEEMAYGCKALIEITASVVYLTPGQRTNIETFLVQFLNRTKVVPDPLEIAQALLICNYLQDPSQHRAAGVSVGEFLEIEALKNSVSITRRLCRLNNKLQGISFAAPQESDKLTVNQLREYAQILSKGVKAITLERVVFEREVCVYLNETIATEEYVRLLDTTTGQYNTLLDGAISFVSGDAKEILNICNKLNPPPKDMMTILSMNKLTQDPEVLKMFARMVSSSPKERTSGIHDICKAVTETRLVSLVL